MTNHTLHPSLANGKTCPRCKAFKTPDSFALRDGGRRLKSWCQECLKAKSLDRYYANHEANKEKHRHRARQWYQKDPEHARRLQAEWKAKNPDRVKAIQERNKPKKAAYKKLYRQQNAKRLSEQHADYRRRTADRIKSYGAAYYRANKEVVLERIRKCIEKKPKLYFYLHKAAKHRRAVRLKNSGPTERFTDLEIFERDSWVCQLCHRPVDRTLQYPDPMSPSLDHKLPIARGGGHTRKNVQCAHLCCNLSKRDRI